MSQDKAEIERQLQHYKETLGVWRRHAEHVQLQIAKFGFDVPSKLLQELREYQEQIKKVESQINELAIQAVEEDFSLAEAEYRVMAAEAWENGYLTTRGTAQLKYLN